MVTIKQGANTLPKAIKAKPGTNLARIVAGDDVRIEPVRELGGSLKAYAKSYVPIEEAREGAAQYLRLRRSDARRKRRS